ncbi:hypothetical protein PAECIP111892_02142 [Paenibacillus auburnensis]|uniref:Uncharacterized protein n=1 Tax=Paenibacillus auburnensis TaxID=2905649 RepID=A0ABN8G8M2_9BACL|nr:hypothetical protein [Paenibacillus auburnensis]CAH1195993.1 hypothetical protein PAECIP111892_02142 [Paenibacillus auburnensis]
MSHTDPEQSEYEKLVPARKLAGTAVTERQTAYIDDQLLPQQKIEAGGPPRRVDLDTLPAPIRYIGYAVMFGIPVLFLVLIIVSFIK